MPDVTESTATADGRWSRIRVRTLESLAYRDYRILWTAAMLNSTGHGAKSVVVGWFTYHVTGSAVLTALALGLETLPNLLASPVGGVLADRIDRRKLMAGAAIYNALLTVGLSAMFLANRAEPWHVLVYVVVMGMGTAMGDPARTSYIAYLVPKGKLLNAFALLSLAYNVATLVGPAAAGVLIAAFGPGKTMWAAVALFLATAVVVMPLTPVSFSPQSQRPSGFSQLAEGVAAMARDPVVVALFLSQVIVYAVMVPTVYGMLPGLRRRGLRRRPSRPWRSDLLPRRRGHHRRSCHGDSRLRDPSGMGDSCRSHGRRLRHDRLLLHYLVRRCHRTPRRLQRLHREPDRHQEQRNPVPGARPSERARSGAYHDVERFLSPGRPPIWRTRPVAGRPHGDPPRRRAGPGRHSRPAGPVPAATAVQVAVAAGTAHPIAWSVCAPRRSGVESGRRRNPVFGRHKVHLERRSIIFMCRADRVVVRQR